MPTVRLSDVYIRDVYESMTSVNTVDKTAIVESGMAVTNPILTEKAGSGGYNVELPFWNDLDQTKEPNYSSSDPSVFAVPEKVNAAFQTARVAYLNKSYQAADLATELGRGDPLQHVRDRFGRYKQGQFQRRVLSTLLGVMNSNIANNSGDMVHDISTQDGANATEANILAVPALIDGALTMGDNLTAVTSISVHSVVYGNMLKRNEIEFIRASEGNLEIPFYKGKRVIVDDGMPVIAGTTSGFRYVSFLNGPGILGYGEDEPANASWMERVEQAGNGGGIETIGERWNWVVHPFGFNFNNAVLTGGEAFATLADLRNATNWTRVVPRRNVPLAFLVTNG